MSCLCRLEGHALAGIPMTVPTLALVDDTTDEPHLTILTTNSGQELVTHRAAISQIDTDRRLRGPTPLRSPWDTKGVVTTPRGGVTVRTVGFEEGVSLDDTRSHTGRLGLAMPAHAVRAVTDSTIHGATIWLIAAPVDLDEVIELRRDCVRRTRVSRASPDLSGPSSPVVPASRERDLR